MFITTTSRAWSWGRVRFSEREELHQSDPEALYRAYLLPVTTKAEIAQSNVIVRLRQAHYVLQRPGDAYLPKEEVGEAVDEPAGSRELRAAAAPFSALLAFGDHWWDVRMPREIQASLRAHDWLDFVVAAVVTSLA
jgi:hypothetical protein